MGERIISDREGDRVEERKVRGGGGRGRKAALNVEGIKLELLLS